MSEPGERPVLLAVDDEPRILSALARALRREPLRLLTAASGDEALVLLRRQRVDAIVSDRKMPGMDGLEFLEAAARLAPRAGRILLTGWTEAIAPAQRERLGLVALVPKPWDDAELKAAIRRALGAAPRSPAPPDGPG